MALHPDKERVLRLELIRLADEARGNDTALDLSARRTPGPLTDDEWVEFADALGRVPEAARTFGRVDRASRRLTMTRRGQ